MSVTIARSRSTKLLKRLDLPTFGRPVIAFDAFLKQTSGSVSFGQLLNAALTVASLSIS